VRARPPARLCVRYPMRRRRPVVFFFPFDFSSLRFAAAEDPSPRNFTQRHRHGGCAADGRGDGRPQRHRWFAAIS